MLALAAACPAAPPVAAPRGVTLQLKQESWRQNKFSPTALVKRCAEMGIRLTAAESDHAVELEYVEEEGPVFRWRSNSEEGGRSTVIGYSLRVVRRSDAHTIGKLEARFGLPFEMITSRPRGGTGAFEQQLYKTVLDHFADSIALRLSCSFVAAALGSEPEYRNILRWAIVREDGLAALKSLDVAPPDEASATGVAIAQRRFPAPSAFPASAVPYLRMYLESQLVGSEFSRAASPHPDVIRDVTVALDLLVGVDPRVAAEAFPGWLRSLSLEYPDYRQETGWVPVFSRLIRAVGTSDAACSKRAASLAEPARRSDAAGALAREALAGLNCRK